MLSPVDFISTSLSPLENYIEIFSDVPTENIPETFTVNTETNLYGLETTIKNKTVQTSSFIDIMNSLFSPLSQNLFNPDSSNFIIPGLRHLTPGIVVFERPPCHKIVSVDQDFRDNIGESTKSTEYYVPLPWQVYVAAYNPFDMRLTSVKMFFAASSLVSPHQELYCPPLFNFYSNGTLCRPFFSSMNDIEKYSQDVSGIIASAYDWVWNSGFNYDITENIAEFLFKKKFHCFKEYMITPDALKAYEYLENNSINGYVRPLPTSHLDNFFRCWQEVPLEKASSLSWSYYSDKEFFYQEESSMSYLSTHLLYEFANNNSFTVHEEPACYDYDCDCDDYDEEEAIAWLNHEDGDCDENCYTLEELRDQPEFKTFLESRIEVTEKHLDNVLKHSHKFNVSGFASKITPADKALNRAFYSSVSIVASI